MRSQTVEQVLESFAAPGGGPGGRAGAALHAALGAAFVARAAASVGGRTGETANELREVALGLATQSPGAAPADGARAAVRVIEVAERALTLAETLRPMGDRASVTDVANAAEALRAAVGTARVDVESHLVAITDPADREELLLAIDPVDDVVLRAAKVTAVVREQIHR